MILRYFFDLPVYRLSCEKYNQAMDNRVNSQLDPIRRFPGYEPPPATINSIRQRQDDQYGSWQFNEVLGYIRLYFLGTQVRGEYYSAEKARNSLGRCKVFSFRDQKLASEIEIFPRSDVTNSEIWEAIQQYVRRCRKELRKERVIDDSILQTIGPHVDWLAILGRGSE